MFGKLCDQVLDILNACDARHAQINKGEIEFRVLILAGQVFTPTQSETDSGADGAALTPREREVLFCLQRGESNKQIARVLDIQETTVKLHLRSLALKLEARNRTEVVVKAIQSGLIA